MCSWSQGTIIRNFAFVVPVSCWTKKTVCHFELQVWHKSCPVRKRIYALKIYLFKAQLKLIARATKIIYWFCCVFINLVYVKQSNEAPLTIRAPLNDINFSTVLKTYPKWVVADIAHTEFLRNLWFLFEHLAGLSFFDDIVSAKTKNNGEKSTAIIDTRCFSS